MKRIYSFFFVTMAMLMLSVSSAWAQYVKLIDEDGTVSWIEIEGTINGTNIEISSYAIAINTKGSINLNEVWSQSGGSGIHYQVTNIRENAFKGCFGLTSVTIPNSVTRIYYQAFSDCHSLTSVTIEDGTETLSFKVSSKN